MHVTIEKDCWDYILDISGSILIPLAIFFIGNIWMKAENERKTNIDKLNYLTLYSHKLMYECGRLKVTEEQRKTALENFIENPTPANYSSAFCVMRTPNLKYDIFAGDYAFLSDQFPQLLNIVFEIDSKLRDITEYIHDFNRYGDIGCNLGITKQVELATIMISSLDKFHQKCNWLIFYINNLFMSIKVYNSSYFFQQLLSIRFEGQIKEIIDLAINELDEIYKFQNPNWKDGLIDDPQNPPIKFTINNKIHILYLKLCGAMSRINKDIKKKFYKIKNDEYIEEQINVVSFCNADNEMRFCILQTLSNKEVFTI